MRVNVATDLLSLIDVYEKLGITFFLQDGNSLGYGRFQDVIENDNDIDIGITQPITEKDKRRMCKALLDKGWNTFLDSIDFLYAQRTVPLNVWYYHREGNMYTAYPESTPGTKFTFPAYFLENPDEVEFYGKKVHVPHDLNMFLTFRYGEDWAETTYESSEAWKKVEEYVFKWKHKIQEEQDPMVVNKRYLQHIGMRFGQERLISMNLVQPNLPSSAKQNS